MKELRPEYFNLYTTVKDIFYHLWLIMMAAAVGFLGVRCYYIWTYHPQYTSSMLISVSATTGGQYAYSNINRTIEAASTFGELFDSVYFRDRLKELTGLDADGVVRVEQPQETNLITLSYTCDTPVEAYQTLRAMFDNYDTITDHRFQNMILNELNSPTVSTAPSNHPGTGRKDVYAAAAAAFAVILITFVFSFLRDTVKNTGDVEAMLSTDLFTVIPHEEKNKTIRAKLRNRHNKAPLMITDVLVDSAFIEAFNRALLKLDYYQKTQGVRSVMITSLGENEGKSTVAVNLALSAAAAGKDVILIDLDLRKPSIFKFFAETKELETVEGIGDVLNGTASLQSAVRKDSATGLYLLCGNKRFSESSELLTTDRFRHFLSALESQFDLVIIDTSPYMMVADAEIAASSIDACLTVVRQDTALVSDINDMLDTFIRSDTKLLGCVFNDYHELRLRFQREVT